MSLPNGLRTLLERAHDLVLVTTTTDGQIVFWNPAAERRLGHRVRDVIGHAIGEILPSEAEPWQLPLASGFDRTFEVRTRTRSGRTIWLDVTAFAADERAIVIYVVRDVTRTRELLRSLHEHLVPQSHDTRLTPREREVLRAIAAGLGTAAMAERMGVSRATIRNHAQNIFGKLGAHTRLEAVMLATRRRLL